MRKKVLFRKTLVGFVVLFLLVTILLPAVVNPAFAWEVPNPDNGQDDITEHYQQLISREKGSILDRMVGSAIGAFAGFLMSVQSSILGFKNLDALLFNKGVTEETPPFDKDYWAKLDQWYDTMRIISGSLLFLATAVVGYKFIAVGLNPGAREEAIDSLKRLAFSWILLLVAPYFVSVLLKINNLLVAQLATVTGAKSLDGFLGPKGKILDEIRTGNCVITALILLMFSYINFKLNMLFLIRYFVITVLYIFTPIVVVMWVISKDVNAAGIWLGEMLSNAFMQFAYAFVFMVYLSFIGENVNWATAFIWAMLLISVGDILRNSVQSLMTRLSGINENAEASRIMGVFGLGGIASAANTVAGQFSSIRGVGGSALLRGSGAAIGMAAGSMMGSPSHGGFFASGSPGATGGSSGGGSPTASISVNGPTMSGGAANTAAGGGDVAPAGPGTTAAGPGVGTMPGTAGKVGADISSPQPNGPTGGVIGKVGGIAAAFDTSSGIGHIAERTIGTFGSFGAAADGATGTGFVKGLGKSVAMGARALGGGVAMGYAVNKYAKEKGVGRYQALREIVNTADRKGAAGHITTIWRGANLYASHVFSTPERVREKLLTYHATSIDGMRYK